MTDIYITKYALTSGISRYTMDHVAGDMVVVHSLGGMNRCEIYHRPDWHLTIHEAEARAAVMQSAKLKSLAKQIENIKSLNFCGAPILDRRWDGKS